MNLPVSYIIVSFCLIILFSGCDKTPQIDDSMLDGDVLFDPSVNNPEEYLISAKYPTPSDTELSKHVIIAVHGYTATTFEWSEFAEWSEDKDYMISQVLLGAHGKTYDEFKASKWEDWRESILLEYEKLFNLGYRKISFVGSSTGATLILNLIEEGYFDKFVQPKNIFFIDPIIVPSSKLQSIAGIIGPMLVYVEVDQSTAENRHWYRFRPLDTVNELNELIIKMRKKLEDGFTLSDETYMKVFHSKHDPVANSLSTVLIYKGLKHKSGKKIEAQIMDSDIHVFTRLKLRDNITTLQKNNQIDVFEQMAEKLLIY